MLNHSLYAIGLMSGTSLDGVDIGYFRFNIGEPYSFEIINSKTIQYNEQWLKRISKAYTGQENVNVLDKDYGRFLGSLIKDFINENMISKLNFIASHGHTIFHKPEEGYTLQIGDGQEIANVTNHKVINDFRTQDVQLGGQGAPLVPVGDRLLFGSYNYCLNLGGFANISYEEAGKRIAYDICPVNIVLNHYANKLGLKYDNKGQLASGGSINKELLHELDQLSFYRKAPPKSLGLEWVEASVFPLIDSFGLEVKDILRTFVEHIATQIINQFQENDKSVLVTGGGALNEFLISGIRQLTATTIVIPERKLIDYKEALIFAFLGLLRTQNKVNVLSSVTGARKDHSSGRVFMPMN